MLTVGIDVGSITAKAAVVEDGEVISDKLMLTGYNTRQAWENVFENIITEAGIKPSAIDKIVSTGYGRKSVRVADMAVTEITCHAAGAHYLNPAVQSVIDTSIVENLIITIPIIAPNNMYIASPNSNFRCRGISGRICQPYLFHPTWWRSRIPQVQ